MRITIRNQVLFGPEFSGPWPNVFHVARSLAGFDDQEEGHPCRTRTQHNTPASNTKGKRALVVMIMDLDTTDGTAFHIAALRILLTVVTVFIATYILATISTSTGDLIQDPLLRGRYYYSLIQNEQEEPSDRNIEISAAAAVSMTHIFFICFHFWTGDERFSASAVVLYAEGLCILLLAIEAVGMLIVAIIRLLARGLQWYIDTRLRYAAWWEDDGMYD
ncbi:hypothetical protein CBER1_07906 [Cercospora berteroae]|uniref:Uncharacterized protein n=1 Tax=Cercospora berteroae TaxID=357750 RepID=A0A2S6BUH4_9PEZI|nr:hypothetical protein CBER1_07906 [Cercospora berteroae]